MFGTSLRPIGMLLMFAISPVAVGASPKLASCHGCTASQREMAAVAVTPNPGFAEVLVVDGVNESVYKYEVTIDREPGLFVTSVNELTVSTDDVRPFQAIWGAVASTKEVAVPPEVCSGISTYLYEATCRGRTSTFLRQGDGTLVSALNGLIFGGTAVRQQVLAAFNINQPVSLTLRFSDGSYLRIRITISSEADSGAYSIADMQIIEAIGPDGVAYPIAPEGIAGLVVENVSLRTIEDLVRLFSGWQVPIVRGCTPLSNRTRMVCDRVPSGPGQLPTCRVTTGC